MPESAILKKRGLGYGRKIPPINFRISGDQLAELEAEVAAAKKDGDAISVNEAARRRCFPEGPKLIRVEAVHGSEVAVEALSVEELLRAPFLQRFSEQPGFARWVVWDGIWTRPGRYLVGELRSETRVVVARLTQGKLSGLPKVKALQ